jgi:hypothetical protein
MSPGRKMDRRPGLLSAVVSLAKVLFEPYIHAYEKITASHFLNFTLRFSVAPVTPRNRGHRARRAASGFLTTANVTNGCPFNKSSSFCLRCSNSPRNHNADVNRAASEASAAHFRGICQIRSIRGETLRVFCAKPYGRMVSRKERKDRQGPIRR